MKRAPPGYSRRGIVVLHREPAAIYGCRARCVWVPDQPQWRSARELNALLAEVDELAGRAVRCSWSENTRWLVRHRFADERIVERTHVYKLTLPGAELRPLPVQLRAHVVRALWHISVITGPPRKLVQQTSGPAAVYSG